jgi:di/tricarboxylate transporter
MMNRTKGLAGILISISAAIVFSVPPTGSLGKEGIRAAGLVVLAVGFWATGVLPEHHTALLFLLLCIISKVAPASVVFSGFHSSAVWLVFGGLVLAVSVKTTGLALRMAHWLLDSFGTSYTAVITGVVVLAVLFSFFIPSTLGRVVLLVPIVTAMAERLGFSEGSPGHDGMVMASTLACYEPSCAVLPANVPNMVAAGAAESLYKISFSYAEYLKLHFPVTGLLKSLSLIVLILMLFPDRIGSACSAPKRKGEPFSHRESMLTLILSLTLLLWGTDSFHGVSPAWIALAGALLCMLPFFGFFPDGDFGRAINLAPFFYVAGVVGLGAVVANTGMGDLVGQWLIDMIGFERGHDVRNFFSLVILSTALGPLTTSPGVPAVFTPLSADLATATGFPLITVLMTQVIGFSTLLFPYQAPPVVVGMQLGKVRAGKGVRMTLALALVSIFILMPINYLWWALLGIFGH